MARTQIVRWLKNCLNSRREDRSSFLYQDAPKEYQARENNELENISKGLAKILYSDRRTKIVLEELNKDLGELKKSLAEILPQQPPLEELLDFAEAFCLLHLSHKDGHEGSAIVFAKMKKMLKVFGLDILAEKNVVFNDTIHEICSLRTDTGEPSGTVLEIVRPGFRYLGRVVRQAVVVVSK